MDDEALAQRKEYDQVINERDILGTQLIRRNDELALLYEKLKVMESALRAGESQYSMRIDDIRVLKMKIKDLLEAASAGATSSGSIASVPSGGGKSKGKKVKANLLSFVVPESDKQEPTIIKRARP